MDAVIYVLNTGIARSELAEQYGKPNTVWKPFDRWRVNGVWERIAKTLSDPDLEEIRLDSSNVKVHPIASTDRRKTAEKKTNARSAACGPGKEDELRVTLTL